MISSDITNKLLEVDSFLTSFQGFFFVASMPTKMFDEIVVRRNGGATKWLGDENENAMRRNGGATKWMTTK